MLLCFKAIYHNPENCSVLRSELIAIDEGLKPILNRTDSSNVCILTDSRSAIQHLQDWTRVDDLVSIRIINKLKTVAKYRYVHFQWIPPHVNLEMKSRVSWPKEAALRLRPLIICTHVSRDLLFNENQGQASLDGPSRPCRD
ncbi:RNase H domain-containing protein [Trichonephila clavipes]|nr:RNase H domain-containing protein [Trichonephila clavipes]